MICGLSYSSRNILSSIPPLFYLRKANNSGLQHCGCEQHPGWSLLCFYRWSLLAGKTISELIPGVILPEARTCVCGLCREKPRPCNKETDDHYMGAICGRRQVRSCCFRGWGTLTARCRVTLCHFKDPIKRTSLPRCEKDCGAIPAVRW